MGGQPPRGEVVGVFTVLHQRVETDAVVITANGDNGTVVLTLPSTTVDYTKKDKKVVVSITEYVE